MDRPPILGFDSPRDTLVTWADGTALGILSLPPADPEIEARIEAERQRKEHIRQSANVIVLDDWRNR